MKGNKGETFARLDAPGAPLAAKNKFTIHFFILTRPMVIREK
jgi:hypothetical protein